MMTSVLNRGLSPIVVSIWSLFFASVIIFTWVLLFPRMLCGN